MTEFSNRSRERLATCHPDLQRLFNEVIKDFDCTILCGHRNRQDQEEAYHNGNSNAHWPDSPHNKLPSIAVDVAPWPLNWNDSEQFLALRNWVDMTARIMGIEIKPILRFKNLRGNLVTDYPHYELV